MNARYQIFHDTHYHYDSPVSLAQQLVHLWPRACAWQRCEDQQLQVDPLPTRRRDALDSFGNPLTRLALERPHDQLRVVTRVQVEVLARPLPDLGASPSWEQARQALAYSGQPLCAASVDACRFRFESPYVRLKQRFVTFAEPQSIGLSALCGLWLPVPRQAPHGAWMRLDPQSPEALLVPLAPGLLQGCGVAAAGRLEPGVAHGLALASGTLALDGEREIEFNVHDRPTVTLDAGGPLSIDVEATLACAAQQRLLAIGREHPQHPMNLQSQDTPGE